MGFSRNSGRLVAGLVLTGMLLSIVLAAVVSFYASSAPDGLERVAQDTGFDHTAQDSATADSPLADYELSGAGDERFSVAAAGVLGVAITAAAAFGLFALLKPRSPSSESP